MKKCASFLIVLFAVTGICLAQEGIKWSLEKSTHFIVYYKNAPGDFIKQLIDNSENYYGKISSDLGFNRFNFWLWDDRAKIYIYNNADDYQAATGQPGWSGGSALPRDKIIKTFAYAKGFFETVLAHEMGHIIFREFVGFDNPAVPLWLDEGVASYQEKLKYANARPLLREALAEGSFMKLEGLFAFEPHTALSDSSISLFYAEAFSIVDFLIREFGRDKFVYFCQSL